MKLVTACKNNVRDENLKRRRKKLTVSSPYDPRLRLLAAMLLILSFSILNTLEFVKVVKSDPSSETTLPNVIQTASTGIYRKIKSKKKNTKGGKSTIYYNVAKAKASKRAKSSAAASSAISFEKQSVAPPTCRPYLYHHVGIPTPAPMLTTLSNPPLVITFSPQTRHPTTVPQLPATIIPTTSIPNDLNNQICNMSITKRISDILNIIIPISGFDNVMTTDTDSPIYKATQWIIHIDEARLCPDDSATIQQRYAFVVFYYSTSLLPWNYCGADPTTSPCFDGLTTEKTQRISTSSTEDIDYITALKNTSLASEFSQRWLSAGHVCSWYGVKCNGQLEATNIWLDANNLIGTIPFELSVISNSLSGLSLLHNSLYGTLPYSLGGSFNMVDFHVAFNNFSGTVPESYGNWSVLKSFNVEGNSLEGFLFSNKNALFRASYKSIENLILSDNSFQGTVSPSFGAFTNLTRLLLDRNEFTGTMPTSVCRLPNLVQLVADCAGTQPRIICSCCTTCYDETGGGNLLPTFAPTSPILKPIFSSPPVEQPQSSYAPMRPPLAPQPLNTLNPTVASSSNVSKCNMTSAERESQIREIIGQAAPSTPEVEEALDWILNVDEYYLCPSDKTLYQRYALAVFYYGMNGNEWSQCSQNLSLPCDGREPSVNANESAMPTRWLSPTSECYWYGVSCSVSIDGRYELVSEIDLHNNNLSYQIPNEIGLLDSLKVFLLQLNEKINGTLPASIGQLKMLEHLNLDTNRIGGVLPLELFQLQRLEILAVSNNQFSGTLSTMIGNLLNLTWVQLFGNEAFSGTIPTQIGFLKNLTVLTVQHTNFTGYMPDSVCALRESEKLVNGTVISVGGKLSTLQADCASPPYPPRLQCNCCTGCFSDLYTTRT